VDRERGAAFLGAVTLVAFVALADDGTLIGWPIVLAAAAAFMLVVGLRPSTPLPPPPDRDDGEPLDAILVRVPE